MSGDVPTFPADAPAVALDVVFASPDLDALDAVAGVPAHAEEGDLARGSDHRPVWVDLDLEASASGERAG